MQSGAKIRIAGSCILSTRPPSLLSTITRQHNAPILVECKTLRHVVTSAAEAETGALFHNGQNIIAIRRILNVLNHPQPPTPLKTDIITAYGYAQTNIKIKNPSHGICVITGYLIMNNKNPFIFFGIKVQKMTEITLLNIFLQNVIDKYNPGTY